MDLIVWRDDFLTHVSEIDEQHRMLIHLINDAQFKLNATPDPDRKVLEKITDELLCYALYHFETEADLMQQYGYQQADAETHNHQHRLFSNKVVQIREDMKIGKPIPSQELLSFLSDWLLGHILHTDKQLGAFITNQDLQR